MDPPPPKNYARKTASASASAAPAAPSPSPGPSRGPRAVRRTQPQRGSKKTREKQSSLPSPRKQKSGPRKPPKYAPKEPKNNKKNKRRQQHTALPPPAPVSQTEVDVKPVIDREKSAEPKERSQVLQQTEVSQDGRCARAAGRSPEVDPHRALNFGGTIAQSVVEESDEEMEGVEGSEVTSEDVMEFELDSSLAESDESTLVSVAGGEGSSIDEAEPTDFTQEHAPAPVQRLNTNARPSASNSSRVDRGAGAVEKGGLFLPASTKRRNDVHQSLDASRRKKPKPLTPAELRKKLAKEAKEAKKQRGEEVSDSEDDESPPGRSPVPAAVSEVAEPEVGGGCVSLAAAFGIINRKFNASGEMPPLEDYNNLGPKVKEKPQPPPLVDPKVSISRWSERIVASDKDEDRHKRQPIEEEANVIKLREDFRRLRELGLPDICDYLFRTRELNSESGLLLLSHRPDDYVSDLWEDTVKPNGPELYRRCKFDQPKLEGDDAEEQSKSRWARKVAKLKQDGVYEVELLDTLDRVFPGGIDLTEDPVRKVFDTNWVWFSHLVELVFIRRAYSKLAATAFARQVEQRVDITKQMQHSHAKELRRKCGVEHQSHREAFCGGHESCFNASVAEKDAREWAEAHEAMMERLERIVRLDGPP